MLIAILSDTHSNVKNTQLALALMEREGVELVIHCGDICDADTVRLFAGRPGHFVLGNNDFRKAELSYACEEIGVRLHGRFGDFEVEGKRIALLHGDNFDQLEAVSRTDVYDYVFFGHTHEVERNQRGRTLVLNPGALHRARPKTFGLLDLSTGDLEVVKVAE